MYRYHEHTTDALHAMLRRTCKRYDATGDVRLYEAACRMGRELARRYNDDHCLDDGSAAYLPTPYPVD